MMTDGERLVTDHVDALVARDLADAPSLFHLEYEVTSETDGRVKLAWHLMNRPGGDLLGTGHDYFRIADGVIRVQDVIHGHT